MITYTNRRAKIHAKTRLCFLFDRVYFVPRLIGPTYMNIGREMTTLIDKLTFCCQYGTVIGMMIQHSITKWLKGKQGVSIETLFKYIEGDIMISSVNKCITLNSGTGQSFISRSCFIW